MWTINHNNIWSGIWRVCVGVVKNLIVAQDIMSMDPAYPYVHNVVFVIAALTLNIKCSISYGERFCLRVCCKGMCVSESVCIFYASDSFKLLSLASCCSSSSSGITCCWGGVVLADEEASSSSVSFRVTSISVVTGSEVLTSSAGVSSSS